MSTDFSYISSRQHRALLQELRVRVLATAEAVGPLALEPFGERPHEPLSSVDDDEEVDA